jgi:predicted membrane-bound spermidine synthase
MTALAGWENFYVIVGLSAGALIGLQFVVITLIADMPVARGQAQAGDAFATPTIVHFGAVLLLSAIVNAPWQGIVSAAVVLGLMGLAGIVYEVVVVRRMRTQTLYTPQFEDRLFHVLLPCAAYATVAASAYAGLRHADAAMFVLGAAVLLLLFIGIHNAWDAVTYHAFCG